MRAFRASDFFIELPEVLDRLTTCLKGSAIDQMPVKVKKSLEKERPLMAGVWAEDFVTAFQKAAGEKETIDF
ncbi:MAG: hypothetical protein RAK25_02865 [TACK group archaeon]|nr:hypothetical protein [TACK group archaeon]